MAIRHRKVEPSLENDGLNTAEYKNKHSGHLDYFLVLDLEGKVEILEFLVLMVDAGTMDVVAFFHRVLITRLDIKLVSGCILLSLNSLHLYWILSTLKLVHIP